MKTNETIKSIPTLYNSIQFRSRLEAKWAVFFDLCGWHWSYEPVDFNGWIPDFAIGDGATLVEVKPFYHREDWTSTTNQIVSSGCKGPVILLGADATFSTAEFCDAPRIGWFFAPCGIIGGTRLNQWEIYDLNFGVTEGNRKLGLCPLNAGWSNAVWCAPDSPYGGKWSRVWLSEDERRRTLIAFWRQACNVSQWRPRDEH